MAEGLWIPVAAVLAAIVVALLLLFWWKGQPFAGGDVFRASRWSRGNRLFPTQVLITPTSVVHYTPELFGRKEHSIHIVHVASVSIDTNLLFSDVVIETSGGATPVVCHGHRKSHAVRMKQLIEQYQTQIYRTPGAGPAAAGDGLADRGARREVTRG
ncbi:MAG TPA: hypothetical protein VEA16_10115 [Vicinamibacterales bacterium]|nr:hypothetical protein [Vicinamibacterales bacterium]